MSETVLRYSLPNGTHVLIHQSALVGKDVDNLPLIVVEDAANGNGAVEVQSTVCSTEKRTNDETDSETKPTNSCEEQKNFEVLGLDELAEMVTCYKCKKCTFTALKLSDLVQHLKSHNIQRKLQSDLCKTSEGRKLENVDNQSNVPVIVDMCSANNSGGSNSVIAEDSNGDTSEHLVFLCGQCTQGFNSLDACKHHMMQDHELIVQEDEAAIEDSVNTNEEFPKTSRFQEKEFLKSIKETRPVCKLPCTKQGCRLKFPDSSALSTHEGCHVTDGSINQFRCKECGIAFGHWRGCSIHLWTEHNVDTGLLICPICEKYRSAVVTRMVAHMQTHSDARSFCCPDCGKGFKQASQLYNHRVIHMDRKADQLPRWYSTKRCDICFKTYADSKCLKKHIQAVHSKLKPYVCQVCGHASARRAMLQMHLRQHTGEKPHACTVCSYRTGDHNSLRRHIMRHTGQRPYRCPHCPYTAIQSSPYKNHLRSKHPGQEGIFCCIQCSFKTVSQENYVLHVNDHKNGLIPNETSLDKIEMSEDGNTLEALDDSDINSSADRTTETTVQISSEDHEDSGETSNSLLEVQLPDQADDVDTGGITIPANTEHNLEIH